jgi:hypothetical protein
MKQGLRNRVGFHEGLQDVSVHLPARHEITPSARFLSGGNETSEMPRSILVLASPSARQMILL